METQDTTKSYSSINEVVEWQIFQIRNVTCILHPSLYLRFSWRKTICKPSLWIFFSSSSLGLVCRVVDFNFDGFKFIRVDGTCFWCRVYELFACVCSVAQLCPTLHDLLDCSPPGSSVHGVLQAKILEWVPYPTLGDPKPRWFSVFVFFSISLTVLH